MYSIYNYNYGIYFSWLVDNPKAFMCAYIKKLIDSRTTEMNHPCLFDDSNVRSLFGMLDVTNHGYINYEQYKQGMTGNILIKPFLMCTVLLSMKSGFLLFSKN